MTYRTGYKAFNVNDKGELVCSGHVFKEGETYEAEGQPVLCKNGFHFCQHITRTLSYYPHHDQNVYAEVEAFGEVVYEQPGMKKACTNKILIKRVIPKSEIDSMFDDKLNIGIGNTGCSNAGSYNTGGANVGDRNTGYGNVGISNSGNHNVGDYNTGRWNNGYRNSRDGNIGSNNSGTSNEGSSNSGCFNTGNGNAGSWNFGNSNTGNWNACDNETGCFNTEKSDTIRVFNKPCSLEKWKNAVKPDFICFSVKQGETYKQAFQRAYSEATEVDKLLLKQLPNFDKDVFFQISGIMVE